MLTIFVISDATGETGEWVIRSALVQFPGAPAKLVRRGQVGTPERVQAVVQEAAGQDSIILHTLVSDELRHRMLSECRLRGVDSMDIMGPLMDRLATHLKLTPQEKPGLLRQLVQARSREIEAVEFAFRHDDGQNPEDLAQAEVVLVGVSRTMKTPTMLYLAYRGWFAANVPIVPGIELPAELLRVPRERVFCLHVAPARLVELRRARADGAAIPADSYSTPEQVHKELLHAQQLCRERRWRTIQATSRSVEEVGREIILLLPDREMHGGAPG